MKWSELSRDERNILIAEKVIQMPEHQIWRAEFVEWSGRYIHKGQPLTEWQEKQQFKDWEYCGPDFTFSWLHIGLVIGELRIRSDYPYMLQLVQIPQGRWFASFRESADGKFDAICDDAPNAICLAALRAVGVEIEC